MKKLSIFLVALTFSVGAFSQTIIPKAGVTLANVSLSDEIMPSEFSRNFKPGLLFGVGYEIGFGDMLALQPELLFHQKGTKLEASEQGITYTQKNTLNYLELPVLVKVKFGKFYVNAGPYFAYGIGGKYDLELTDGVNTESASGKIKFGTEPDNYQGDDQYIDNAFDLGAALGGGIVIIEKIVIDLRYNMGFANFIDKQDGLNDNKSKNSSIQLSVGYRISFN